MENPSAAGFLLERNFVLFNKVEIRIYQFFTKIFWSFINFVIIKLVSIISSNPASTQSFAKRR